MNYRIFSDVREVIHVSGDTGEHRSGADQCVVEGDDRGQVGDLKRYVVYIKTVLILF